MKLCEECLDGKLINEKHEQYDQLERELVRLVESGQFTYYEAFKRATRLYPATKDCPDCHGTGYMALTDS